jgi:hypothetical protein
MDHVILPVQSAVPMESFGGRADIALSSPVPAYLKKPAPQKMLQHDRELFKAFSKLD